MRLSHNETARIADNLGHLLKAGVPADRIFEVLKSHQRKRRVREALEEVRRRVAQGQTFYEGFRASSHLWPRYFVELIRCSERAGLLYAGFEEGADHFRKMARVHRAAHMLWMGPVLIILFGWVLRALLITVLLGPARGFDFCVSGLQAALPPTAVVLAFVYVPPLRRVMDAVFLHLPLIAETVRDLCIYQFTKCFQYLYVGAVSAPDIVRLASHAMSNTCLQQQVGAAAKGVGGGISFAEALRDKTIWPVDYIKSLSEAELSGQLEVVLDVLARERKEALELRVQVVRGIVERIVGYSVAMTVAWTIYAIICQLKGLSP